MTALVATDGLSFWDAVEETCLAAADLSQQVSSLLDRGCNASECTPLLEREKELLGQLGMQIQQVAGEEPDPRARQRRDRVLARMQALIEQDDRNRHLLGRRGLSINAGGRRPHPRARTRA